MTTIFKNIWPPGLITVIVLIFFLRLFFPPSIFVTPDFGRSDILHSNLPAKLILSNSLRSFSLPLWENKIGGGFPVLAEGITGTFYLPNLLIFFALPFKWAIPVTYFSTFLIAAFGMYFLVLHLKLSKAAATMAAISYAFCASMVLHVQHINYIQAASVLPWCLLCLLSFMEKKTTAKLVFTSILFSQLLLTGFVQLFVYSLIIFGLITTIIFTKTRGAFLRNSTLLILMVAFCLSLSAIQILPSQELVNLSNRKNGVDATEILGRFRYKPINLLTYLGPFILGNAAGGTANANDWSKTGIFWESTNYVGLVSFTFAIFAILLCLVKSRSRLLLALVSTFVVSVLLALGQNSPLHVLFSMPILNNFRVPARFILFSQFTLILLGAYGLNYFLKKMRANRMASLFIIFIVCVDLFHNWWNYNPIQRYEFWSTPPQSANSITKENHERIISIDPPKYWNQIFKTSGWMGELENYHFFLNGLDQNLNLAYGISQLKTFETIPTRRYLALQQTIDRNIFPAGNQTIITSSAKELLDSNSVSHIVSTSEIKSVGYKLVGKIQKNDFVYYIYQSNNPKPRFSFYDDWKTYKTLGEFFTLEKSYDLNHAALIEKTINISPSAGNHTVNVIEDNNTNIKALVQTDKPSLLLNSDAFYPGWIATIDGVKTEIIPANINSRAIVIPAGSHIVSLKYRPSSFYLGSIITFASVALAVALLLKAFRRQHRRYSF